MSRIRQNFEQIKGVRQRLQDLVRKPEQEGQVEKRLARELQQERDEKQRANRELQQERERRQLAETKLMQLREGAAVGAEQAHALPEPDDSLPKLQICRALIAPLKPGKLLDLGAGRGNFSLSAARLGWEVTAVDARTMRWPDPEKDPKRAELIRSVDWVVADVREFPIRDGDYDLICSFGLLHHLEANDQIDLLRRCSGRLTLLSARLAPQITATEGPYEGMYVREPGETREERDQVHLASWGNEFSFWHTEESLLRLLRDCGYSKVMTMRPPHKRDYTMFLCLPIPLKGADISERGHVSLP